MVLRFSLALFLFLFSLESVYASPGSCAELIEKGSVLTTVEVLKGINSSRQSKYRLHPDQVDTYTLEIGQVFFIVPGALSHVPNIQNRVSGVMEVRVVDIKNVAQEKGWKGNRRLIYVEIEGVGVVAIPSYKLRNTAFITRDFEQHAPFERGEYVQIGSDFDSEWVVPIQDRPGDTAIFSGRFSSYIGRFIGVYDATNYLVEVRATQRNIPPTNVIIPKDRVYGLKSGTLNNFQNAVKPLLDIEFSFRKDELVRFRSSQGLIEIGIVLRFESESVVIQSEADEVRVAKNEIFKYIEGNPVTPLFDADWIQIEFRSQEGSLRDFLNGAAKISSMSDYIQMSPLEKITTLMKYLESNVEWTKAALEAENAGLTDFRDIICSGGGVCRHLVVLLAVVLAEAGFPVRIVTYKPIEEEKYSHAWLEVDANTTLVVDPSNGSFVQPLWLVRKTANENQSSFESQWYLKEGREYLLPPKE